MIVSLFDDEIEYKFAVEELKMLEEKLGEKILRCKTKEDALNALPEADIVVTLGSGPFAIPLDEDLLNVCAKLKLVLCFNAGVEELPLNALKEMGVTVGNGQGAHGSTIAEYVIGGMIALNRKFNMFMKNQQEHAWVRSAPGWNLEGKTICIIGTGSIGRVIGKKASRMDMRVIGVRKHPQPMEYFEDVMGADRLHDALKQSDYIVLIMPLTDETYHMLGKGQFALMKKDAVIINVSRGDTINEEEMITALKEGQIRGAVLDVFHKEPLPKDSPLWDIDNVIITPHIAGPSLNTQQNAVDIIYDKIIKFRNNEEIPNKII